jgi:protein-disulfide isomerase
MSRCALLLVALAACQRGGLPSGDVLATMTVPAVEGLFDAKTLYGAPTVVAFVSPRCGHCLATIPSIEAAARGEGVNELLVFASGNAAQGKSVVAYTHFTGPAIVDDGSLVERYHVEAVPYMLVLDTDGYARDRLEGEQPEDEIRDAIDNAR